jgi:hypothetical protein
MHRSSAVIAEAPGIATESLEAFEGLLGKHGLVELNMAIAGFAAGRDRAQAPAAGAVGALVPQVEKLELADADRFAPMCAAARSHAPDAALGWIDSYLSRSAALTPGTDQEIRLLRLTFRGLQHQIAALSGQKAETERGFASDRQVVGMAPVDRTKRLSFGCNRLGGGRTLGPSVNRGH